jgi:uncharacterized protein (TIGR03437 family)
VIPPGPPQPGIVTCLANAATYGGYTYDGFVTSPGEIVSLFGNQIGPPTPVTATFDAAGNVTSQLAGIQVLVGGRPAPLLYAAPNQINLVVPFGLAANTTADVELRRNGGVAASFRAITAAQHPGLFTLDSTGTGLLAALNQDGSMNSTANPAGGGTAVVLFATGLGAMTPAPVDGSRRIRLHRGSVRSTRLHASPASHQLPCKSSEIRFNAHCPRGCRSSAPP